MKKTIVIHAIIALALLSCGGGEFKVSTPNPAILSAFTTGIVSSSSPIVIRFTNEMVAEADLSAPVTEQLFAFDPGIDGLTVWAETRTLEFRPHQKLRSGQTYRCRLFLHKIMKVEREEDKEFLFQINVIEQSFEVVIDGLKITDQNQPGKVSLQGTLTTADGAENDNVEKILTALHDGKEMKIAWTHPANENRHSFTVSGIERQKTATELVLKWNGSSIGVDKQGETKTTIPAIGDYEVLNITPVKDQEQYVEIAFSDPIAKNQDLRGLITIQGEPNLRYQIDSNIVKVFNLSEWPTEVTVTVHPGIINSLGYQLKKGNTETVVFKVLEPQVRFMGKGTILPTTAGLTVPIETMNLNAIVVEAFYVFENNMDQFFQVNRYNETKELHRVGRVVWQKTIPLEWNSTKRNRWVRYGLDLSELTKKHSKGLYRLKISFKRRHIEYTCASGADEEQTTAGRDLSAYGYEETETSYWDYYEDDSSNGWDFYSQRKNPCHPAYYRVYYDHDISVSKNVIVSDLGLIAKKGEDDKIFLAVSDIRTASPLGSVSVRVYDFQRQKIAEGGTGGDGTVTLPVEGIPYLVVAEKDDQRGYLRVDPASALSISHFDVGGEASKKGLKGFIYGERGVWRPGDPLFLTFVLVDTLKRLPKTHPVILRFMNPKGQVVKTVTQTVSENGFYHFKLQTDAAAPTGDWLARIMVGGEIFEKTLKVETIMPNRIKIGLDFGKGTTVLKGSALAAALSAAWLHGAPARNLKAEVNVTFTPTATRFKTFPDYDFDDPSRVFSPSSRSLFSAYLDENGRATVSATLDVDQSSPGMLLANFNTRVFESGGAFSVDRFSIPYHPYRRYLGLRVPKGDKTRGMLLTDKQHSVNLVVVDPDGNPVKQARVQVAMYKIKWRWWWEKEEEDLANYIGTSSYQPLFTGTVNLVNGKGDWKFEIKYPDWGRYFIHVRDLEGNHNTGKILYVDWPGWAGRAQSDQTQGANMLSFSSDKETYNVGEKITLTIPVATQGRGMVCIEAGGKLLSTEFFSPNGKEESYRYVFTATADMTPNIYAHVTFLQPHMQAGNDMPIRLYGVIPINVENPETRLKPVIACADVFQPESQQTIEVSESSGRPMTYTLAVVDEGLLSLTRFATPDPWEYFFKRQAIAVGTWDVYDYIAAAYGGKLEQLLAIGGGEGEFVPDKGKKADRFPPLVRFMGPFSLGPNAKKTHTIDIPLYVGAVRVMLVAGNGSAFGNIEKAVTVKKPLMLLGTMPRVASITETFDLPVTVFTTESKIRNVTVTIAVQGPVAVEGENKKTLAFTAPGDGMVSFRLKAQNRPGIARVSITGSGGGETISQTIEFDVRVPSAPVVDTYAQRLQPEQSYSNEITLPGLKGTNELVLEVSRVPPLNLGERLDFLIHYPYGCIEQTVSSVFPQLYLPKLLELSAKQTDEIQHNVTAGISRVQFFQSSDGGFSYWPGYGMSDEWASNYAGHFLLEAQRLSYHVPSGVLIQWQKYQRNRAVNYIRTNDRSDLIQAYRLFTLALNNTPEIGAMNRLRESADLPIVARWQLAAAYALVGQKDAAAELVRSRTIVFLPYRELSYTYGSDLRDRAIVLDAMATVGNFSQEEALVKEISDGLCADEWLSTQTTGYCLVAMARYAGVRAGSGTISFAYALDDKAAIQKETALPLIQIPLNVANRGSVKVNVQNKSGRILFTRLIAKGLPEPGQETYAENGIQLDVRYLTSTGEVLPVESIRQGTDFIAEIRVRNTGVRNYQEIALAALFPSGWEIHNARMDATGYTASSQYDYMDVRDDRVYLFFDLNRGDQKTFQVLLNASYAGRFYLPLIQAEAMYDARINGRTPGKWIQVIGSEN